MEYKHITTKELKELANEHRQVIVAQGIYSKDINECITTFQIILGNNGVDLSYFNKPRIHCYTSNGVLTYAIVIIPKKKCRDTKKQMENAKMLIRLSSSIYKTVNLETFMAREAHKGGIKNILKTFNSSQLFNNEIKYYLKFRDYKNKKSVITRVEFINDPMNLEKKALIHPNSPYIPDGYEVNIDSKCDEITSILATITSVAFRFNQLQLSEFMIQHNKEKVKYDVVVTTNSVKLQIKN